MDAVPVGNVPEAATWAMLLVGFFAVGVAARRQPAAVAGEGRSPAG